MCCCPASIQRLRALQMQGAEEVEVSVVDLSPEDERRLNLALNKVGGDWDLPKLADVLTDLRELDMDLAPTGFRQSDIEDLLRDLTAPVFEPSTPEGDPLTLREVTQEQVATAQEQQDTRFVGVRQLREVTCPHCGNEFGLDPA